MAQYFVICTNSGDDDQDPEERNTITALLERKGWQAWHWFEDLWLAVNTNAKHQTSTSLMNEIRRHIPKDRSLLITEVKPLDLAGFGPKEGWKWTDMHWPGHLDD